LGSLQTRLLFTYLLVIVVTLGLTVAGLFFVLSSYRDTISYGNLEDIAALVPAQVAFQIQNNSAAGDAPLDQDLLSLELQGYVARIGDAGSEAAVMVIDRQGLVIAGRFKGARVFDAEGGDSLRLSSSPERCRFHPPGGRELLCVSTPLSALSESTRAAFEGSGAAAFVVAKPAADLEEVLSDLLPRLAFAGLIGFAAAMAMAFLLSQSVASPLRRIARAARGVARGSYNQRIPLTGPREVREVASNFNRMTAEVQRSQQTLRDFLMNISHEIKTPLTSIRGFSQAVLDGTIDDAEGIARSARIINDESTRVLRLVEELLDLSRLESGQVSMAREPVDLAELLGHVEEVFALRSEESGVRLDVSRPAGLRIRGDFDRLEQVLNNLLDNAFRHTPAGGAVRLAARPGPPGFVQVSVADTGKGIAPEDLPHLFDRFYRAGNGRNTKGYGLGLAITREIVRAHGGEIAATSEAGKGTVFTFTLPAISGEVSPDRRPRPAGAPVRARS
jgi:signal transduction histidine kinase